MQVRKVEAGKIFVMLCQWHFLLVLPFYASCVAGDAGCTNGIGEFDTGDVVGLLQVSAPAVAIREAHSSAGSSGRQQSQQQQTEPQQTERQQEEPQLQQQQQQQISPPDSEFFEVVHILIDQRITPQLRPILHKLYIALAGLDKAASALCSSVTQAHSSIFGLLASGGSGAAQIGTLTMAVAEVVEDVSKHMQKGSGYIDVLIHIIGDNKDLNASAVAAQEAAGELSRLAAHFAHFNITDSLDIEMVFTNVSLEAQVFKQEVADVAEHFVAGFQPKLAAMRKINAYQDMTDWVVSHVRGIVHEIAANLVNCANELVEDILQGGTSLAAEKAVERVAA